jgi:hypothetical protein
MKTQPNDDKAAEMLRWLLHYIVDMVESRLSARVDSWIHRLRREAKKPDTVTLSPDDYKEVR